MLRSACGAPRKSRSASGTYFGEVVERPCTKPLGVEPPRRRMLCTLGGLEIPMPLTLSWVGFIAGWIAVALLVVGFLWIVRG